LSLYADLLLRASQPYAQTLIKWIGTGQLTDPHDEFMIRESRSVDRSSLEQDYTDEYWERKYTLKDVSLASSSSVGPRSDERGPLDQRGLLGTMAIDGLDQAPPRTRAEKRGAGLGGGAIVPSFLERMKLKILLAGKYLNVIRECGSATGDDLRAIIARQASQLSGSRGTDPEELVRINSADFAAKIDSAYLSANTALLQLLITQQSLFPRLRSLKHHFFLDHGDSFTHFLDLAQAELTKRARHISLSKLQSLLDVAIRNPGSASGADPYKEDVKVAMSTSTLSEWLMNIVKTKGALGNWAGDEGDALSMPMESVGSLKALSLPAESVASIRELDRASGGKKDDKSASALTGFDALSLDYTVQFPLSLVVSRKAILRYQLIFRHLLSLKHLEQLLTATWAEHARAPAWRARSGHPVLEKWKNRVFALRARMLAFVQQMYAFAVAEVLEGNWRALMAKLESVATVDGLLRYHHDFLDSCLKECMLTNDDLLKVRSSERPEKTVVRDGS
jgi:gamma-tubulin complex component 2